MRAKHSLSLEELEGRELLAAGDVVPTFGELGIVATEAPTESREYDDMRRLVAVGEDWVLIGGDTSYPTRGFQSALLRVNLAGERDFSFGESGFLKLPFKTANARFASAVVQADGKLIVASNVTGNGTRPQLIRLYEDGTLDTSFGNSGFSALGPSMNHAELLVRADGKIQVFGRDVDRFVSARFNADGSVDHSFGEQGAVTVDFLDSMFGRRLYLPGEAIETQDGGLIVSAVLRENVSNEYSLVLRKFDEQGQPDLGFGENGTRLISLIDKVAQPHSWRIAMLLNPDGTFFVGQTLGDSSSPVPWLAKLTPTGELVAEFGESGTLRLSQTDLPAMHLSDLLMHQNQLYLIGTGDSGRSVVTLEPTGEVKQVETASSRHDIRGESILAGDRIFTLTYDEFASFSLSDSTFHSSFIPFHIGTGLYSEGVASVELPNGSILTLMQESSIESTSEIVLKRFTIGGEETRTKLLGPSSNWNDQYKLDIGGRPNFTVLSDAVFLSFYSQGAMVFYRFSIDGTLDTSFGEQGRLLREGLNGTAQVHVTQEAVFEGYYFRQDPRIVYIVNKMNHDFEPVEEFGLGGSIELPAGISGNAIEFLETNSGIVVLTTVQGITLTKIDSRTGEVDPAFGDEGNVNVFFALVARKAWDSSSRWTAGRLWPPRKL